MHELPDLRPKLRKWANGLMLKVCGQSRNMGIVNYKVNT